MPARRGTDLCVNHDPDYQAAMQQARQRGGREVHRERRHLRQTELPADLLQPADLMKLNALVMKKVAIDQLDTRIAATLSQLIKLQSELWTTHIAQKLADQAEAQLGLKKEGAP